MADDAPPDSPQPSSRLKRTIMMAGIAMSALFIVFAALTVVVMKVGKVHDVWCKRVGTFCAKDVAKLPPVPAAPGGCPDYKMKGILSARTTDDPDWDMKADISGEILMKQPDAGAAGKSSISCFNGQFMATFSDMSNGVLYHCMGSVDGRSYNGLCRVSFGDGQEMAGQFTN